MPELSHEEKVRNSLESLETVNNFFKGLLTRFAGAEPTGPQMFSYVRAELKKNPNLVNAMVYMQENTTNAAKCMMILDIATQCGAIPDDDAELLKMFEEHEAKLNAEKAHLN